MTSPLSNSMAEVSGTQAQNTILAGTELIRSISSSILGPKGNFKMLSHPDGKITISNDGATVLKGILLDHAAAQIIVDASTTQDWEVGDGTTSVALLASSILKLIKDKAENIHPIALIKGLEHALEISNKVIDKLSMACNDDELHKLALTTLNSKITGNKSDKFASICVEAIKRASCTCGESIKSGEVHLHGVEGKDFVVLGEGGENIMQEDIKSKKAESKCSCINEADLSLISIIKVSGTISNSFLCPGILIPTNKYIPTLINPKVLVANTNLDHVKVKLSSAKVDVQRISEMAEIEKAENERLLEKVEMMTSVPYNILINRQIIYDKPMEAFEAKGISVVENVGFESVERLAELSNSKIIGDFSKGKDFEVGQISKVDSIKIGSEKFVRCLGEGGSCSILLSGSSPVALEELERSVHDALCVLARVRSDKRVVYGGGSIECSIAIELLKSASSFSGGESVAIEIFAEALLEIPKVLCNNGGGNGPELLNRLKYLISKGYKSCGVNLSDLSYNFDRYGKKNTKTSNFYADDSMNKDTSVDKFIGCMKQQGIYEASRIKMRVLSAAVECAQIISKCDSVLKCNPRERSGH